MRGPAELARQFRAGEIVRDSYWTDMQRWHLLLREYSALLEQSPEVESIEVLASDLIVKLRDGSRFYWEPEDARTPPSVAVNNGAYESEIVGLLRRLAAVARTTLDIGANIGWVSVQLGHEIAKRGGHLVAFEPLPPTFARLSRNLALNGLEDTVEAMNVGLGERRDTACFYLPESTGSVAASRRRLYPSEEHRSFECVIETIDDVVAAQCIAAVDLIKCDVEGAELFALRGGTEVLSTHRPVVLLEMLRKWAAAFDYHPNDIINLMASYDYACYSVEDAKIEPISTVEEGTTATNYLFIPRNAGNNPTAAAAREIAGMG